MWYTYKCQGNQLKKKKKVEKNLHLGLYSNRKCVTIMNVKENKKKTNYEVYYYDKTNF